MTGLLFHFFLIEKLFPNDLSILYFIEGNFIHFLAAHAFHRTIYPHTNAEKSTAHNRGCCVTSMHFFHHFTKPFSFFFDGRQSFHRLQSRRTWWLNTHGIVCKKFVLDLVPLSCL